MDLFASAVEFRLCRQPQARKNRGGLGDTLALGLDPRVPQRGAGDARRDPAAGRSDVQTKSPARAANSLALFAWYRRRTPPPDAADDFLLNSKKVMPRRPPPSRVRGRVARTRLSLLTTHQTYPRTPLRPRTPFQLSSERGVVDRAAMRGERGVWRGGVCSSMAAFVVDGQRASASATPGFASVRSKRRQRGEVGGIKQAQGYAEWQKCCSG